MAESEGYRQLLFGPIGRLVCAVLLLEIVSATQILAYATILPKIAESFHGESNYAWFFGIGVVALYSAMPLVNPIVAKFGVRRLLVSAILGYALGTALSALSATMVEFFVGRFLTSFSTQFLAVIGLTNILVLVPGHLRSRLIALTSTAWLIPALIGPIIGAFFTSRFGWRIGISVFVLPMLVVQGLLLTTQGTGLPVNPTRRSLHPWMAIPLVAGLTAGLWGASLHTIFGSFMAIIGSGMSIFFARKVLLSEPSRRATGILGLLVLAFCYFGTENLLSTIAIRVYNGSLFNSGIALMLGSIGWAGVSLIQPTLKRKLPLGSLLMSTFVLILSIVFIALAVSNFSYFGLSFIYGFWILAGVAMGFVYPEIYTSAMDVDTEGAVDGAVQLILAESLGASIASLISGGLIALSFSSVRSMQIGLALSADTFALISCVLIVISAKLQRSKESVTRV